ncbi:hypothetical protein [Morganella morganii]|uniref:hypothetical protein n=1 Tax=Morganella morganii TaxID=582 RepID=UPI003EC031C2
MFNKPRIRRNNTFMRIFITGLFLLLFLVLFYLLFNAINIFFVGELKEYLIDFIISNSGYMAISISAIVLVFTLISYVNTGIGKRSEINYRDVKIRHEINKIKNELNELKENPNDNIKRIDLSDDERDDLIKSAKKRIIGNTLLLADLELKSDIEKFKKANKITEYHRAFSNRIGNEIDRINRRGGVNLIFGFSIAITGIFYLGYTILNRSVGIGNVEYLYYMIPRVSFVIVIELFAYFFLRLYRNGFEEVKYYQNELTNFDSKILGLRFLSDVDNEDIKVNILKDLINTERNFVLNKGQSTVALEECKIKMHEERNFIEILSNLLKSK